MDILVYTKPETLEKKLNPDLAEAYWDFAGAPKHVEVFEDRLYFATQGTIKGFFEIDEVFYERITFDPRTWVELKNPISHHQFQGFKYVREDLKQKIEETN